MASVWVSWRRGGWRDDQAAGRGAPMKYRDTVNPAGRSRSGSLAKVGEGQCRLTAERAAGAAKSGGYRIRVE